MPTLQEQINTAVADIAADAQILKDVVNGPVSGAGSVVTTAGGDVNSLAKAIDLVGTAPADSAAAAAVSEANAAASEANAAASAAAAAASAGSGPYTTVAILTTGIHNIEIANSRTYYICDTSGGNVTINLPSIGADEGTMYGFEKSGVANDIITTRDGTDTINNVAGSYTISADTEVVQFIADDNTPDNWIANIQSQTVAGAGLKKTGSTISLEGDVTIDTDGNMSGHGAGIVYDATTARTLTKAADNGATIIFTNAAAVTVTVPQTSTEAIPAGFQCTLIQAGAGQVTLAFEGTDTLNGVAANLAIQTQHSAAWLTKQTAGSPNAYLVVGDVA